MRSLVAPARSKNPGVFVAAEKCKGALSKNPVISLNNSIVPCKGCKSFKTVSNSRWVLQCLCVHYVLRGDKSVDSRTTVPPDGSRNSGESNHSPDTFIVPLTS